MSVLKQSAVKFGKQEYSLLQALALTVLLYDLQLIGYNVSTTVVLLPLYVFFGFIAFIFALWALVAVLMFATGNGHKVKFTYTPRKK